MTKVDYTELHNQTCYMMWVAQTFLKEAAYKSMDGEELDVVSIQTAAEALRRTCKILDSAVAAYGHKA